MTSDQENSRHHPPKRADGSLDDERAVEEGLAVLDGAPPLRPRREVRSRVLGYARSATTRYESADGKGRLERWALPITAAAVIAGVIGARYQAANSLAERTEPAPVQMLEAPERPRELTIGEPFPDFAAIDVSTGEQVALSELRGEVVLLNLWATWCGPCETEMPSMERLYGELARDGLRVVAISVDQESTSLVRRWVEERGITFTVLHDRAGLFERWFRTFGVPESFVLDRAGTLIAREVGPRLWDSPPFSGIIRALFDDNGEED